MDLILHAPIHDVRLDRVAIDDECHHHGAEKSFASRDLDRELLVLNIFAIIVMVNILTIVNDLVIPEPEPLLAEIMPDDRLRHVLGQEYNSVNRTHIQEDLEQIALCICQQVRSEGCHATCRKVLEMICHKFYGALTLLK